MEVVYEFKSEEMRKHMQYVGEVFSLGSGITKTGRGKRLYAEIIPEDKRELADKMVTKCRFVCSSFRHGKIPLKLDEIEVLQLLIQYCNKLYEVSR